MPDPSSKQSLSGVVTGENLRKLLTHSREEGYSIPVFHCSSSIRCDKILLASETCKVPVAICIRMQSCSSSKETAANAVALAHHIRRKASFLSIPVVMYSEHCHATLPLLEELLSANRDYYALHTEPLFSSHTLDLTQDPCWEDNIAICALYFTRHFVPIGLWLEMELSTQSQVCDRQMKKVSAALSEISGSFLLATRHVCTNRNQAGDQDMLIFNTVEGCKQDNNAKSGFFVLRGHCCERGIEACVRNGLIAPGRTDFKF